MLMLDDKTYHAVLPWNSPDAEISRYDDYGKLPQQDIDVCLMCELCAGACDVCDGHGNVRGSRGRPKVEIDTELLRKMLRLRKCNKELCAALNVSYGTLNKYKKEILNGGID